MTGSLLRLGAFQCCLGIGNDHGRRLDGSANVISTSAASRTFVTRAGRKHATQVPPACLTLGYTTPADPWLRSVRASACDAT